jgi:hypothetical protein
VCAALSSPPPALQGLAGRGTVGARWLGRHRMFPFPLPRSAWRWGGWGGGN